MKFYPYHITHLHLNAQAIEPPDVTNNAAYVVIWWKDIPIGELFIEQGNTWTSREYKQEVIKAIAPTADQYSKTGQYNMHALQVAFAPFTDIELPASVDISIVICTRNRAGYVKKCLHSLTQLACKPKEIIVIDNAPPGEETKKVVSEFADVIYYKEPRPGLDIARNAGIHQSTASIVAFVDDDVTVHPHFAYWTWKTFEDNNIGAMTGLVLAAALDTEAQYIFEKEWRFNRGYLDKIYDSNFFHSTLKWGPPVWQIGAGANMAFRKSILQQTGIFDERLDVGAAGCNGDSELWFRILAKGFSIAYNPRAVVTHEHRREMKALQKQLFNYMRGFTAAALIQQQYCKEAGYRRHIYLRLPKWYLKELRKGFPKYQRRYATIFSEIKGMFSGFLFYQKHKNKHG